MRKSFLVFALFLLNIVVYGQSFRDVSLLDLEHGKVKSCTWNNHQPTEDIVAKVFNSSATFKPDGTANWPWESSKHFTMNGIIRNENGGASQIVAGTHWNVTWDSSGLVSSIEYVDDIGGMVYKYFYDDDNRLEECGEYWTVWGSEDLAKAFGFKYLEYDSHGNWIKRECSIHTSEGVTKEIETRTITYYN